MGGNISFNLNSELVIPLIKSMASVHLQTILSFWTPWKQEAGPQAVVYLIWHHLQMHFAAYFIVLSCLSASPLLKGYLKEWTLTLTCIYSFIQAAIEH